MSASEFVTLQYMEDTYKNLRLEISIFAVAIAGVPSLHSCYSVSPILMASRSHKKYWNRKSAVRACSIYSSMNIAMIYHKLTILVVDTIEMFFVLLKHFAASLRNDL